MKRLATLAAVIASGLIPISAVRAQTAPSASYTIPFSFNANGVQMEAGRYAVGAQGTSVSSLTGHGGGAFFMSTPQLQGQKRARLVFHKVGNAYFLAELWSDDGMGIRVPMSKRESQMARSQEPSTTPNVVLLAQR